MAKKRTKAKKRRAKKPSRSKGMLTQVGKTLLALSILIVLVVLAGLLANHMLQWPAKNARPATASAPPVTRKVPQHTPPTYEVFPEKDTAAKPLNGLPVLPGDQPPLVAIIIDDIGYDRKQAARFFDIDAPITFSILPFATFSQQLAARARAKGHEIMLHLPMEPNEYPQINPGPGALLSRMGPDEMISQLKANLDQIPGLKGVNNHMGSAFSKSPERMRIIFSVLKQRGLYYVDSRTTADTVARPSAQLLHLPFAERDIFIDHFQDAEFIQGQIKQLVKRAKRQGYAVGIAHPYETTLTVLKASLPQLKSSVQIVPASMVIDSVMLAQADKR